MGQAETDDAKAWFRGDIEGLRAVAVLAITLYHFSMPGIPGGFVGVDVFFAISGYLITTLLVREAERTDRINLANFYARRARRLLPAALAMTIVTLAVGFLLFSPMEQLRAGKAAAVSSAYLSNFWFLKQTWDYFSPMAAMNPFLHTWSLGVEEQFYLVWPAMVMLAWKLTKSHRGVAMALLGATLVSLALSIWLTGAKQSWAFYSSPTRAWEFGVGGLFALLPATAITSRLGKLAPLISWLCVATLVTTFALLREAVPFPGVVAIIPVVATGLLLHLGSTASRFGPAGMLSLPPVLWLGQRSYAIYLWHWPVIVFARVLFFDISWTIVIGALLLTIALAALSYAVLENPVRRSKWLADRATRALTLAAGLTVAGVVIGGCTATFAHRASQTPAQRAISKGITERPIASGSKPAGCVVRFTQSKPVACTFGDTKSDHVMVLWGDSHADQWSSALNVIAQRRGMRLVTLLKSACQVSDVPKFNKHLRRISPECAEWRRQSVRMIHDLKPDIVIFSQFSNGNVDRPDIDQPFNAPPYESPPVEVWSAGLKKSLVAIRGAADQVIVLRDTPDPPFDVGACLGRAAWHGAPSSRCGFTRSLGNSAVLGRVERQVVEQAGGSFIDLTDAFCGETVCDPVINGVVVYRDTNHMSARAAMMFAPRLEAALLEAKAPLGKVAVAD